VDNAYQIKLEAEKWQGKQQYLLIGHKEGRATTQ